MEQERILLWSDLPPCHNCLEGFNGCTLGISIISAFGAGFEFKFECPRYRPAKEDEIKNKGLET